MSWLAVSKEPSNFFHHVTGELCSPIEQYLLRYSHSGEDTHNSFGYSGGGNVLEGNGLWITSPRRSGYTDVHD